MTRADAENAMRNFEYGRYEKFDLKATLKTLPYRTFLIESEAFPNQNPHFLKTLAKARNEIDGSIRNAFLARILDATMEVDVLHVDNDDAKTVKCLSYVFPFYERMSINKMAYDATGWVLTTLTTAGSRLQS